jgi:iron complex outermembrane recepter protein
MEPVLPRPWLARLIAASLMTAVASAQTARDTADTSNGEDDRTSISDDGTVVLSPFRVDTSKDRGYRVTNANTGTRLAMPVKELPANLEVITSDFIRDTGAVNLRQALRYSAGVVLESQSDAFYEPDSDPSSAGANDPRGATRRAGDSTTKLRGFVIDQVLRDGFRRQYAADSINIERVEVLRGPSALLYGVGSFGGVINYMPKRPLNNPRYYAGVSVGTNDFVRAEFDATGPMGNHAWRPAYRLTAAYQERGDHTEWYNRKSLQVSPVFTFRPHPNTEITLDNEFGYSNERGVGFQNLRANINAGASRTASWITDTSNGLINTRTFRWSGPDTYLEGPFRNNVIDVTQKVTEDLFLKVGYANSATTFDSRQIRNTGTVNTPFSNTLPVNYSPTATISIGGTAFNLREALTAANTNGTFQGMTPFQIYQNRPPGSFRGDVLYGFLANDTVENRVTDQPPTAGNGAIRYEWIDHDRTEYRDQVRAEANYRLDLGRWGTHNFLAGMQYMEFKADEQQFGPPYSFANNPVADIDRYSYHNPGDYSYFRYGVQGDGRPDNPRTHYWDRVARTWDLGYYGVYQGQFFNKRLTIIGGARWDRNDRRTVTDYVYEANRDDLVETRVSPDAPTATSPQIGVSFQVNRQINVFALHSTGVVPNYTARDGLGNAFAPTKAKNYEAGVKFDLWDGRISGTISGFKIERENTPKYLWWAPSPYNSLLNGYNPDLPTRVIWGYPNPEAVWYAIKQTNLDVAKKVFPSGYHPTLEAMAQIPAGANQYTPAAGFSSIPGVQRWWDWNIDPATGLRGLQGESEANTNAGSTANGMYFPLLDMNDPQVAAFAVAAKLDYTGWGGNFWYTPGQTYYDAQGNAGVGNAPTGNGADVPIDDEAKGWDAQIIFTPTDQLQIVANYANIKRRITSPTYRFVKAPYWPLGWWYVRDGYFGTLSYNKSASEVYDDITDTTTYKAQIPEYAQAADDTPRHTASLWVRYSLDRVIPVRGVTLGVGGYWEDKRQWFTGFSGGGGNITTVEGASGERELVQLWTKDRLTINAFAQYQTRINDRYNARFALNVDNLLDDQKRYGEIFAPGASYRFTVGIDF